MLGIFKKKSEKYKLFKQYEKLLKEAHKLSTSNRSASDAKYQEGDEILKKIDNLQPNE